MIIKKSHQRIYYFKEQKCDQEKEQKYFKI